MKQLEFAGVTVVLVGLFVETLSFGAFGVFRDQFTFFEIDDCADVRHRETWQGPAPSLWMRRSRVGFEMHCCAWI